MKKIKGLALFLLMAFQFCKAQPASPAYESAIKSWQQKREAALTADHGWLNLAGLYWLEIGENSFGSGKNNKILFPEGSIAAEAGVLSFDGHTVLLTSKQAPITIDGKQVTTAVVYHADSSDNPMMASGTLRWTIIKRWNRVGIRLRDLASAQLKNFHGIDRYPLDSSWKVEATLMKPAFPAQIMITNVLGTSQLEPSPGKLMFLLNGKSYSLDALEEYGELFIIFADETSAIETYGAGRYLKATMPGADGKTILDFNKAYNPPCAFTPYATCPLPPKQNVLPIAVTAGEKEYKMH